jgi:peptidoglycan/xylan/chitin deacetylase (PgdA/CDA1 family)
MANARRSKRAIAADAATAVGLTRLLEALPKRPSLVVLNYHRVGDSTRTAHDPDVFSATVEGFFELIGHLKKRYTVVSLAEALEIVVGRRTPEGVAVLLTFDDGYMDNYVHAFPILRTYAVPATFFLVTSFVGTRNVPYWDRIAYSVRNSRRDVIRLGAPYDVELDLRRMDRLFATRQVLRLFKSPTMNAPDRFLAALSDACDVPPPEVSERVWLSWDEAAEMLRAGMDIGAHTHTHRILARLPLEEQVDELATSRRILQERLGVNALACAYPDGQRSAFNADTFEAMRQTGYTVGFSYYGGANYLPITTPFNVLRTSVDQDMNAARLRVRLALAGLGQEL